MRENIVVYKEARDKHFKEAGIEKVSIDGEVLNLILEGGKEYSFMKGDWFPNPHHNKGTQYKVLYGKSQDKLKPVALFFKKTKRKF